MPGDMAKVSIGRQDREVVTDAKLRQQCVDRTDLNTAPATSVSQLGGIDVVLPGRRQKRQRREAIEDPLGRSGPGKALQKLLQNQAGGEQRLTGLSRAHQFAYFRRREGRIAAKCQRPDAGIDEQAQWRERSAL